MPSGIKSSPLFSRIALTSSLLIMVENLYSESATVAGLTKCKCVSECFCYRSDSSYCRKHGSRSTMALSTGSRRFAMSGVVRRR